MTFRNSSIKAFKPCKEIFFFIFSTDIETLLKIVRDGQFLRRLPLCLASVVVIETLKYNHLVGLPSALATEPRAP